MGGCQQSVGYGPARGEKVSKPEILALIPARGGSKGIPRKNIRSFAGYPLLAYSIAAGLQAKTEMRVVVTTDDEEIAEVARACGAETPFLRPAELAEDRTTDLPVFQHALNWLAEHEDYQPQIVVHLRPTTPIRPPDLVDRAIAVLRAHPEADSVRGITPAHQNPFKMWLMDGEDRPIRPLTSVPGIEEPYNSPRQVLPAAYSHTGLIDTIRPRTILELNSMSGKIILPILFDLSYDADLDTLQDWKSAEDKVLHDQPKMVWPGRPHRSMPEAPRLLVLDFDGVLTDNRVWVDQDGREMVAANRSDSLGIKRLQQAGVETVVISMETNPVVAARCRKMNISWFQGENDKATAISKLLLERKVNANEAVFLGNDVNDLPCFPLVGWAVAVADAMPEVVRQADFVLTRPGGKAAVRELCDLIMEKMSNDSGA
jgi:YrbI family 3-deoxy-D-manno-octulosonate 8-phosphate phosphatase